MYKYKPKIIRYRFNLLIMASIAFLFYFSTNSYAAPTLVEGNIDSLNILTYTKSLDGKPLLLFSEQIEDKKINLFNKIDNIVLYDSTWQDLAVEFAVQSVIVSPPRKASQRGRQSTVEIEKEGVYEAFVQSSQSAIDSSEVEIKIDGKELLWTAIYESQDRGRKYRKLGERRLKAGRRLIKIKNIGRNQKIFLVNKQKRLRVKEVVRQKMDERKFDTAHIFSQDGEFYVPKGKNYILKMRVVRKLAESKKSVNSEVPIDVPSLEIDGEKFSIGDYIGKERISNSDGLWYELNNLDLKQGAHKIGLLSSDNFKVNLVLLEPATINQKSVNNFEPEITFKKINPTKYLVKVSRARKPFWLVFSESFHKGWRLYRSQVAGRPGRKAQRAGKSQDGFKDIVADYSDLGVREARHLQKFTPGDIKYLFRRADVKEHFLVNGYANGWYIDPKKLGLGKDFSLVIYFWPQNLFYLGLIISGLTLLVCIGYLAWNWRRRKVGGGGRK